MSPYSLKEMPDEAELLRLIKEAPKPATELLQQIILERFLEPLHPQLKSKLVDIPYDDAVDIVGDTCRKMCEKVAAKTEPLKYEEESEPLAWLTKVMKNARIDYFREQARRNRIAPSIPLDAKIEHNDGSVTCLADTVTDTSLQEEDETDDLTEQECRDLIWAVAKQCLRKEKDILLLERRLNGDMSALPGDSDNATDSRWSRLVDKLQEIVAQQKWSLQEQRALLKQQN